MSLVLNSYAPALSHETALRRVVGAAHRLEMAVSYVQPSGWRILKSMSPTGLLARSRLLFTDQMGITHPEAIRLALGARMEVFRYSGAHTFHPKVYLAYSRDGRPCAYLLGSANLSHSALLSGVEAGWTGEDAETCLKLAEWIRELRTAQAAALSTEMLPALERTWLAASAQRAQRVLRREPAAAQDATRPLPPSPETIDVVEDLLGEARLPLATLGFDLAASNIRTFEEASRVASDWLMWAGRTDDTAQKKHSEMRILGFVDDTHRLTELGRQAAGGLDQAALAKAWCRWLSHADETDLHARLANGRRAIRRFWQMQPEVREFFLREEASLQARPVLQAIELLAQGSPASAHLSLEEVRAASEALLGGRLQLPRYLADAIKKYLNNKGIRGWDLGTRSLVLRTWRDLG